jgi:hypothetical protein
MTPKPGKYKIACGREAVVARVKHRFGSWQLEGSILDADGVWVFYAWNLDGSSIHGEADHALVMPARPTLPPPDNIVRFPKIFRAASTISFGGVQ